MAARPEPTVALSIRDLRDPNEFDLELLRAEGSEYGPVRARGARVLDEAPARVAPKLRLVSEPAPAMPEPEVARPRRSLPVWAAAGFAALTIASALVTWLALTR